MAISRQEFIFTIGYDGPVAVIDGQAKRSYGNLSTRELAEKGLFRAAYSSAVYSRDPGEIRLVAEVYNRLTGGLSPGGSVETAGLDRLFGVFPVDAKRSILL